MRCQAPQDNKSEAEAGTYIPPYTHMFVGIANVFWPCFVSRFGQFSCTGRDGWWKGGGGRFESDFPRDCRERCRGGGARTVEGSSAFCFCYELRMLSCAARPHRTTKVRLRRGHTYRHIHICLWALQMFFCHVLWADSVSFLARDGMVGEKAEADALRATSPEIAESVAEEVVPELLRAVPLSVFATNLECCHALPGPTGQQKWGWGGVGSHLAANWGFVLLSHGGCGPNTAGTFAPECTAERPTHRKGLVLASISAHVELGMLHSLFKNSGDCRFLKRPLLKRPFNLRQVGESADGALYI